MLGEVGRILMTSLPPIVIIRWMTGRVVCPLCGDVIGAYEPLLVVGGGVARRSSLLREPLLASGENVIVHHACGLELGISGLEGGRPATAEPCSPDA